MNFVIKLSRKRYLILFMFSLCTFINGACWISFAPLSSALVKVNIFIPLTIIKNYDVSLFIVNYMSFIFMIAFLPVNFPSVIALDNKGLRFGILTGIGLTVLGTWMRCLIN
jgi:FLVCR family feline leukemia virus subgroup C receptor-related protein